MEGSELTIGPVCEALGVTRLWLLGSDAPLPETIDLPVSMLVELMDAADALYPTEEQRWRQLRQWLSRLTGRPASEFASAAPLMLAVRRQFRSSRDEDLQAVTVWRRAQPRPADVSQVQLTVRPENAARLRRLAQQLGSEEAALEFLLQMDDHCGKGASLRRTRWPPKVHYESARGQVKIDVGTEMVCVVLSQFKPAPKTRPEPPVMVVPATQLSTSAPAPVKPEAVSTPEEPVHVNGHAAASATAPAAAPPPARPSEGAPPAPLSLGSGYGTVVRDATLPAQMFADDDLAPEQLAEVQDQLTSVLDRLAAGEDSNMASSTGEDATETEPAAGKAAETASTASAAGDSGDLAVGDESSASMTVGDDSSSMAAAVEECANMAEVGDDSSNMAAAVEDSGDAAVSVEGSGVTMTGGDAETKVTVEESSADEIGVVAEEMVSAEDMGVVTEDMEIVSKEMPDEVGEMEAVGEMAVASEEVAVEDDVQLEHETVEETVTEEVGTVSVDEMLGGMSDSMEPSEPALRREAGLLSGGETALPEQLVEVPVDQLVELPEQLLTSDGEPEEAAQTVEAMELGEEVVMEAEEVGQEVDV